MENALLSKLQEAQGQVEETKNSLAMSEERVALLERDRARQEAAVSALTKQLQDANRWELSRVFFCDYCCRGEIVNLNIVASDVTAVSVFKASTAVLL